MHIYDTQIYILSTGPMLNAGDKIYITIYKNYGVTQQPTVLVLEDKLIYLYKH